MVDLQPIPSSSLPKRATTYILDPVDHTPTFRLDKDNKSYKHQYSNIYYQRLKHLRGFVQEHAHERWAHISGNPVFVPRVLDILKSQLCYIVGTVYLDMPLKPNVMEDIARDHSIPPPPPPSKFCSPSDTIMLEDESGRLKLVGDRIVHARLVTGVVMGALGMETPDGDFEVVDVCFPGLPPQIETNEEEHKADDEMDVDDSASGANDEWLAVISGLYVGSSTSPDAVIHMLIEYLAGEEGGIEDQLAAAQISRLIIAGNSFAPLTVASRTDYKPAPEAGEKKVRGRYGQDTSNFSPHPTTTLSGYLNDIGSVMPIHILAGESDPSGSILPQQPFPRGLLGAVASLPSFTCETNPTYLRIGAGTDADKPISRAILVNSGQPLNDMFKYVVSPPATRLSVLESTLNWRHMAPTAPDTLWCHPYNLTDPFMFKGTPDIYLVGGQKKFATKMVEQGRTRCRLVLVPEFTSTATLVLVNLRTLAVKTRTFRTNDCIDVKMETV